MPEYLSPGVYIEEIEIGGKPIEGVGTSTAGFLGQTERGPITPILVTGFEEFRRIYGSYIDKSFLAYAVDGFFRNGGQRCYIGKIVRVAHGATNAKPVEQIIVGDTLLISTVGSGSWGTRVAVKIGEAGLEGGVAVDKSKLFKLIVTYWTELPPTNDDKPKIDPFDFAKRNDPDRREPTVTEIFDNISADPVSPDYFKKRVNGISDLIQIEDVADVNKKGKRPTVSELKFLVKPTDKPEQYDGGVDSSITAADYTGTPIEKDVNGERVIERNGLLGFKYVDEINIVCAPDDSLDGVYAELVNHCEDSELKERFAILQSKVDQVPKDLNKIKPDIDSKYAAFYYPWIKILDPRTNREKLIPPGGHVAGIYARSDIERGVHKAPANEIVRGARSLQFTINKGQQDILNPKGVNVIRAFPGRGIRVWGARTLSTDPLWKYINVRRLFLFLEESIDESTQWVVFEPNNEQLWARIKQTITAFLVPVWRSGALMGTTPEEAFFVKVDRTTMTQNDIDTGKLIVIIGVAPTKPAEFVIFRFTQFTAGAEAA